MLQIMVMLCKREKSRVSFQWSDKDRKLWTLVILIGSALAYTCRASMSLAAVQLAEEFGWDKAQMGLVLGSFFWGYPLLQIPGGGLSDRVGGDRVIAVCALIWSTLTVLQPHVPYIFSSKDAILTSMVISRFIQGLAQSPHYPSISSLVGEKVSRLRKGTVIATLFSSTGFGTLVAGLLGSLLLEKYRWPSVFYLFGALSFVWSLFMFWFSRLYRRRDARKSRAEGQELADFSEATQPLVPREMQMEGSGSDADSVMLASNCASMDSDSVPLNSSSVPLGSYGDGTETVKEMEEDAEALDEKEKPFSCRTLIAKVPFWALLLTHQCIDFVFFITLSWLPTYFSETFPQGKGWVFNVLPWVVAVFTSIGSGWFGDWLIENHFPVSVARKVIMTITCIGLAVPLFVVSTTCDYHTALACMVVVVGSQALSNGGIGVNPQDIAPDYAGTVYGISNGLAGVQGFVSTYIVGVILHVSGKWSIVFQLAGAIAVLGWLIFTLLGSGKPVM